MPLQLKTEQQSILIKTGLLIGALVLVYYLGMCGRNSSTYEQEIAKWKTAAATALADNAKTLQHLDSLQKKIDSVDTKASQQKIEIGSLKKQIAASHIPKAQVDSILADAPDTCQKIVAVAQKLQLENENLTALMEKQEALDKDRIDQIRLRDVKYDSLMSAHIKMTSRLDSLTKTVPIHKDPKFLGILPYPSRTMSAVVGAVLGAGVTYAVMAPLVK
jgi:septal ring factor EnvC (AmiA/AmiB activator)